MSLHCPHPSVLPLPAHRNVIQDLEARLQAHECPTVYGIILNITGFKVVAQVIERELKREDGTYCHPLCPISKKSAGFLRAPPTLSHGPEI